MSVVRSGHFNQRNDDQILDRILSEKITCQNAVSRLIGNTTRTVSIPDGTYTVQYCHNGDMREHEYPKFTYESKIIPGCEFKDSLKNRDNISGIISHLHQARSEDEILLCFIVIHKILKSSHKTEYEIQLVENYLKQYQRNFTGFPSAENQWKERNSFKCNIL